MEDEIISSSEIYMQDVVCDVVTKHWELDDFQIYDKVIGMLDVDNIDVFDRVIQLIRLNRFVWMEVSSNEILH